MLLFLLACQPKSADSVDDGQPRIRVITPADGETITTCLTMTVEVDNLEVVSPVDNPDLVDGQGHWHMVFGSLYAPCEALTCAFTLSDYDDGPVTVEAVLADNTYVRLTDDDGNLIQDTVTYTLVGDGVVCDG